MRISIIAVGTRMPAWVQQGVAEYQRRMPPELAVAWREIPLAQRGRNPDLRRAVAREGEQMRAAIPRGDRVIALEVGGHSWSTEELAGQMAAWLQDGCGLSLLVGGPDGLEPGLSRSAAQRWSLSPLTLPHPLVRILLMEQLYRAWTIHSHHPYHR